MNATIAITLLALASTALLVSSAVISYRNRSRFRRFNAVLASRVSHIQKRRMERAELRNRKQLMEDTVREGTTAVEAVHRTITGTTFDLVDRYSRSDEIKAKAKKARQVHDDTTRTFYKAVRSTNRALHVFADMIAEKQNGSGSKPSDSSSSKDKS